MRELRRDRYRSVCTDGGKNLRRNELIRVGDQERCAETLAVCPHSIIEKMVSANHLLNDRMWTHCESLRTPFLITNPNELISA